MITNKELNRQMFLSDLKRFFTSREFIIAVVLINCFLIFTYWSEVAQDVITTYKNEYDQGHGICWILDDVFLFGFIIEFMVMMAAYPIVSGFCADLNTQYARLVAGRVGVKKYIRNKISMCMIGTFLTTFIALLVFILFLFTRHPLIIKDVDYDFETVWPFGFFLRYSPITYLFIKLTCFSAFSMIWAMVGMVVCAYKPNKFVSYVSPFVICYFLKMFEYKYLRYLPEESTRHIRIFHLGMTTIYVPLFEDALLDFLYIIALFTGLSLLLGLVFYRRAKRRLTDEVV